MIFGITKAYFCDILRVIYSFRNTLSILYYLIQISVKFAWNLKQSHELDLEAIQVEEINNRDNLNIIIYKIDLLVMLQLIISLL